MVRVPGCARATIAWLADGYQINSGIGLPRSSTGLGWPN